MPIKKGIHSFIILGLLLGIVFDQMLGHGMSNVFFYSVLALFGLLYGLTYNEKNPIRLIGSSFVVALILSLPLLHANHLPNTFPTHLLSFLAAFPVFVYVGHSFHFAYHHDNTWKVSYDSLFAAVWNTLPLLFIASLFTGLANSLIYLGAAVFKTVGNNVLYDFYFTNVHFRAISNITLFFIGLGIGQQNFKVIYNLRFLLLRIMFYLLPALALISMLYVILFLSHATLLGSSPLEHGIIDPLAVLVPLSILGIIFFNAYFQDGSIDTDAPSWLRVFLRVYRVFLFFIILIMSFKLIQSHNFNSNECIYLLATLFLGLTYAVTAFFSENKAGCWIKRGNIGTALFFFITLFLFNVP